MEYSKPKYKIDEVVMYKYCEEGQTVLAVGKIRSIHQCNLGENWMYYFDGNCSCHDTDIIKIIE